MILVAHGVVAAKPDDRVVAWSPLEEVIRPITGQGVISRPADHSTDATVQGVVLAGLTEVAPGLQVTSRHGKCRQSDVHSPSPPRLVVADDGVSPRPGLDVIPTVSADQHGRSVRSGDGAACADQLIAGSAAIDRGVDPDHCAATVESGRTWRALAKINGVCPSTRFDRDLRHVLGFGGRARPSRLATEVGRSTVAAGNRDFGVPDDVVVVSRAGLVDGSLRLIHIQGPGIVNIVSVQTHRDVVRAILKRLVVQRRCLRTVFVGLQLHGRLDGRGCLGREPGFHHGCRQHAADHQQPANRLGPATNPGGHAILFSRVATLRCPRGSRPQQQPYLRVTYFTRAWQECPAAVAPLRRASRPEGA